jgi:hypothetical protein
VKWNLTELIGPDFFPEAQNFLFPVFSPEYRNKYKGKE